MCVFIYICTDIHKFPIQYDWNNHRNKRLLIARCVAICCWYYYIISSIKEKILPLFQDVCIYYGSLIMIQQVKICMRVLLQLIAGYSISLVALIISKLLIFLFVTFLFLPKVIHPPACIISLLLKLYFSLVFFLLLVYFSLRFDLWTAHKCITRIMCTQVYIIFSYIYVYTEFTCKRDK